MTAPKFAKLYDLDEQQIVFEVLPSQNPQKLVEGIPDVNISTDLGWSRYAARLEMKLTEKGRENVEDINEFFMGTFTEQKAREQLVKITEEFGGQAVVDRMLASGEYNLSDEDDAEQIDALVGSKGGAFAKIIEIDGRQVLAMTSSEMGNNEDQEGLVLKTAMAVNGVLRSEFEGMTLEDFTEDFARQRVEEALRLEKRSSAKPN